MPTPPAAPPPPARRSIALVLGAGGVLGGAWHAAALRALEQATGWDPRAADLLVGTSAGAGVAATLRAGFSAEDHWRAAHREEVRRPDGRVLVPSERLGLPARPDPAPWERLRPTAPWLGVPAFLGPDGIRPGLLAGWLPRGTVDGTPLAERVRRAGIDAWPDAPTWICAVRSRDGKRVVFGRDDVAAGLPEAVQASSSVPGYFRPVRIDGHDHLDGALHSSTNADLVARAAFDLVVVSAPMAARRGELGPRDALTGRALHARTLAAEVQRVTAQGTPVLVLQPGREDLRVMGPDLMDRRRVPEVLGTTDRTVRALLAEPARAGIVEVLDRAGTLAQAATEPTQAP